MKPPQCFGDSGESSARRAGTIPRARSTRFSDRSLWWRCSSRRPAGREPAILSAGQSPPRSWSRRWRSTGNSRWERSRCWQLPQPTIQPGRAAPVCGGRLSSPEAPPSGLALHFGYYWLRFPPGRTPDHSELLKQYTPIYGDNRMSALFALAIESGGAGVLWYSPFVVLAIAGLREHWNSSPRAGWAVLIAVWSTFVGFIVSLSFSKATSPGGLAILHRCWRLVGFLSRRDAPCITPCRVCGSGGRRRRSSARIERRSAPALSGTPIAGGGAVAAAFLSSGTCSSLTATARDRRDHSNELPQCCRYFSVLEPDFGPDRDRKYSDR